MIYNYLKLALRNLRKRLAYSIINIVGLAIGMACVLVIVSYIKLETSYDKFNVNHEQVYRVVMDWEDDGKIISTAMVHAPLAENIVDKIPGIERIVRVYPHFQSVYLGNGKNEKTKVEQFIFADSAFFETFSFKVITGSLKNSLDEPLSVVLTRKMAIQFFGSVDIIDETLRFEDEVAEIYNFNIRAVVEDIPQNSHFHFGFIASFASMKTIVPYYNNWYHPPLYTYLQLAPGTNPTHVEELLDEVINNVIASSRSGAERRTFHLQKLSRIHLHSDLENEWEANSEQSFVQLMAILAGFILLIACINFMNLATVQSSQRAKEIGIRKVMGSLKSQLIIQFLGESYIITLMAFGLALAISELALLHIFNDIISKELSLSFLLNSSNALILALILVLVGLLAGLYPALYLSRFKPVATLKGNLTLKSGSTISFRRVMVVFQFFVASVLLLGTLTVFRQTSLMRNKNLGFDKDYIISLKMVDRYSQKNYTVLREKLLRNSKVSNIGLSATLPGGDGFYGFSITPLGKDEPVMLNTLGVDEGFLRTYDIKIIKGRDFSEDIPSDEREAVILNLAATDLINSSEPIGAELELTIYINGADKRKVRVIGVVDDFHYQSLYNNVDPLLIYINKHPYYSDYLSVKFTGASLAESVQILEDAWKEFHPDKSMDYVFLDTALAEIYDKEEKRSQIFSSFAILSLLISSLGLFGLSAYSIQQRTREIGIRKVLGSTVPGILRLLIKEYMILIIIANILAWPLVIYFANQWLSGFAYHIDLNIWMFLAVILIAMLIAFITISYQALKAAMANPVASLKEE